VSVVDPKSTAAFRSDRPAKDATERLTLNRGGNHELLVAIKHLGEAESLRFVSDDTLFVEEKIDGTNVGIHFSDSKSAISRLICEADHVSLTAALFEALAVSSHQGTVSFGCNSRSEYQTL
jgi:hypothetical protein